ncbi:MAG: 50S ribosomal protein L10 [Candidatus Heimdallarchaeota archaeon]|nr:MAG: 50S ribosomal protein L10 [Candidatus Heimdallarchaeota archaeon]
MAVSTSQSERGYDKKKDQIETIINLAEQSSVVGLVNLSGISSKALQGIRSSMRSGEVEAVIKVAKNTIKTIALEKVGKEGLSKLVSYIDGSCAMIFSDTNPFKLQKFLNQNQVPAPAKTGQISPVDVYISEGLTNLDPGPIISELGVIGLQTRIEKGKIRIIKTAKVLSAGDTVTESHTAVLARLGIQPFKIGLKLAVVLENGELFEGSILDVDENEILSNLKKAYLDALSLAINPEVSYYSEQTTFILLKNAIFQAMSLSLDSGYITDKTVSFFLAKTSKQAEVLKEKVLEENANLEF